MPHQENRYARRMALCIRSYYIQPNLWACGQVSGLRPRTCVYQRDPRGCQGRSPFLGRWMCHGAAGGVSANSLFLCLKEGATTRAITKVSPSCLQPPLCAEPMLLRSLCVHHVSWAGLPWGPVCASVCSV